MSSHVIVAGVPYVLQIRVKTITGFVDCTSTVYRLNSTVTSVIFPLPRDSFSIRVA